MTLPEECTLLMTLCVLNAVVFLNVALAEENSSSFKAEHGIPTGSAVKISRQLFNGSDVGTNDAALILTNSSPLTGAQKLAPTRGYVNSTLDHSMDADITIPPGSSETVIANEGGASVITTSGNNDSGAQEITTSAINDGGAPVITTSRINDGGASVITTSGINDGGAPVITTSGINDVGAPVITTSRINDGGASVITTLGINDVGAPVITTSRINDGGASVITTLGINDVGAPVITTSRINDGGASVITTLGINDVGAPVITTSRINDDGASVITTLGINDGGAPVITTSAINDGGAQVITTSAINDGGAPVFTTSAINDVGAPVITTSGINDGAAQVITTSAINDGGAVITTSGINDGGAPVITTSGINDGGAPVITTSDINDGGASVITTLAINDGGASVITTSGINDGDAPVINTSKINDGGATVITTSGMNDGRPPSTYKVTTPIDGLVAATVIKGTLPISAATESSRGSRLMGRTTEVVEVGHTEELSTAILNEINNNKDQVETSFTESGLLVNGTQGQLGTPKTETFAPASTEDSTPLSIDNHVVNAGGLEKELVAHTAVKHASISTQKNVNSHDLNLKPFSVSSTLPPTTDSNVSADKQQNVTNRFDIIPEVAATSVLTTLPVSDSDTTGQLTLKPLPPVTGTSSQGQLQGREWTSQDNNVVTEAGDRKQDITTFGENLSTKGAKTRIRPIFSPPVTLDQISTEYENISNKIEMKQDITTTRHNFATKATNITTVKTPLILNISSPAVISGHISTEFVNISHMSTSASTVKDERLSTEYNPFVVIWNIPSRKCATTHGRLPKLSHYGIIHNKHQHFYGEQIVIFYANQLGFYPQILPNGEEINGGVPQLANLDIHLAKVRTDIDKRIPNQNFSGYAVIDWEAWRPIFRRNWGAQRLYKKRSVKAMEKYYPGLKYTSIKAIAKKEFDKAARNFMETTLTFAKSLRPQAKWGFYLFPDCYNFKDGQDYCHKKQMRRNDKLSWMFQASGALYPSIYLSQKMGAKYRAAHIKGILGEAYRIQETHTDKWSTPVLPYARLRYGDTDFLLSKEDLEGTIGQAATTGSSGIILWERYVNTLGKRKCFQLEKYIRTILGPYLQIVQNFITNCSKNLCKSNGRCVRKKHVSKNSRSQEEQQKLVSMLTEYKENYRKSFRCKCYQGWTGSRCGRKIQQ